MSARSSPQRASRPDCRWGLGQAFVSSYLRARQHGANAVVAQPEGSPHESADTDRRVLIQPVGVPDSLPRTADHEPHRPVPERGSPPEAPIARSGAGWSSLTAWSAALYALLCLIWGSTWLAIKIGLVGIPPVLSAGMRFILS